MIKKDANGIFFIFHFYFGTDGFKDGVLSGVLL
jgi:hypothetical protein